METVLFINACARPQSRTLKLARLLLGRLGGRVEEVALCQSPPPPLDGPALEERGRLLAAGALSAPQFGYARQFVAAQTIVIAAPYWDLLFPAVLRAYLEQVTVTGVTFRYSPEGVPIGLCRARRLFYVTTAGGPILPGQNLGFDYVKALAGCFYGIPQVRCFAAQGLDVWGADVGGILAAAQAEIESCPL